MLTRFHDAAYDAAAAAADDAMLLTFLRRLRVVCYRARLPFYALLLYAIFRSRRHARCCCRDASAMPYAIIVAHDAGAPLFAMMSSVLMLLPLFDATLLPCHAIRATFCSLRRAAPREDMLP